ncbi:MAG: glutamine amidotransferase [Candidatus Muproteobacteria bacterium RBG_16_64_11]|uniref:Glutamine amidotransferase n=1 Tax=Candidatus Muproteobacteria bacterium RBG_16_64_11 TaxID=1817758 RepID=A0A1F6TIE3_9PROT|nr:MAG: glutamine amidotransferase [Candidatus Muproteobacteria bacterium RBG_16_64_11]
MKDIAIFRHAASEGPGYLAEFLARLGLPQRLIRIDRGDPVPTSIDGFSALVFMGGPMSVNDDLPWIPKILELIRRAVAADLPVLGHCLGGQLIGKALGGVITRNPVKEIGWLPVQQVAGPSAADWLNGLPAEFEVFHWHGETFSIPPGATRILASRDCSNQAFVIGKTLAFQCHVEMTADMVREWARLGSAEVAHTCATVQDPASMTAGLDERVKHLQAIADVLYDRWLRGLEH